MPAPPALDPHVRPSAAPSVDPAQASLVHEVAMAAELSYLWGSQLHEALDGFAQAARTFFQDMAAGKNPDPMQLLVKYGAANELLNQLNQRFDIGGEALSELRFGLAPGVSVPENAGSEAASGNVLFLNRGDRD